MAAPVATRVRIFQKNICSEKFNEKFQISFWKNIEKHTISVTPRLRYRRRRFDGIFVALQVGHIGRHHPDDIL